MIGRTNIPFAATGAVDGVTIADLPTHLSSLTAAANSGKVVLTLGYSDTDFVSGVDVLYKTGSYPTSPTDGECVTASGAARSVTVEGLTNGTKYFFRAYLYRLIGGVKYYQTDETNAKIYATPSAVGISGIEPAAIGENYIVIDQSGTFSLDIPENLTVTAYLVGGGSGGDMADDEDHYGGNGGRGGYVNSFVLSQNSYMDEFTCLIGAGGSGEYDYDEETDNTGGGDTTIISANITTTKASSGTYVLGGQGRSSGFPKSGKDGVLTSYGYVGSSGGVGSHSSTYSAGRGGVGAGNGGELNRNGANATGYGCGGGGGGVYYKNGSYGAMDGGAGMQGCIIIEWA